MTYSYENSKGKTYYLHTKQVKLQNGLERPIYFFAGDVRDGETVDKLPDGYEVSEQAKSGLPVLKKKAS